MKHTKGSFTRDIFNIKGEYKHGTITDERYGKCTVYDEDKYAVASADQNKMGRSEQEAIANAELITEAFNIASETGYTPRQLAEQKVRLLTNIIDLRNYLVSKLSEDHGDLKSILSKVNETIKATS